MSNIFFLKNCPDIRADDYMHYNYGPTKNGKLLSQNTSNPNYRLYFDNIYPQYLGAININSEFANKWLSTYWNYGNNSTSQNENIKEVAYLLDMEIWNQKYKEGYNFIEYVIGGPTLEMYCKSYKDTHPSKYIEYTSDDIGYKIRWGGSTNYIEEISGIPQDELNSIYIKSDRTKAWGMFLAAPYYYNGGEDANPVAAYDGRISNVYYEPNCGTGLRPVACLKSDVQLKKNASTGNFTIVQ